MSDLWILAGQSNMEGCGNLSEVEQPHAHVRSFVHGDRWETAQEPLHSLIEANDPVHWGDATEADLPERRAQARATRTRGAGCGLPFAKAIVNATGRSIDLLPVAHGGTSMQQWSPDRKGDGGRSLYGAMLRRTKLAQQTSPDSPLKGVLWYQGESDCNPNDAAVYAARMEKMISEWRADLGAPDLPFFIVQLGCLKRDEASDPAGVQAWTQIRELQRSLSEKIANYYVIPAIDLDLDDGIHIGTFGLKRLGKRLANAALGAVYGQSAPKPLTVESVTLNGENSIRVRFGNVTGELRVPDPSGRIPGFSLVTEGVRYDNAFFKTTLAPGASSDVLLYGDPVQPTSQLVYGGGFGPFCQLTDSADMAVPAFGPMEISR